MMPIRDFKIKPYPYNLKPEPQITQPFNRDNELMMSKRRGGPLSPIAPGNPREQLSKEEMEMFNYKKGGKVRNKKKKGSKSGMSKISQIQKVNIKIGADLLKSKKEAGDTAMLMKGRQQQLFPSSVSTNLRLESPAFNYAQPLPSIIPGLYQANPSSISQPLVSGKPVSSKGGDLQPKLNNPIVQDTDPNDLQKNQVRDPMIRAVPSGPSVSGSISGILGDNSEVQRSMSSREAGYIPEDEQEFANIILEEPIRVPLTKLRERSVFTRGRKPVQRFINVYERDEYPIDETIVPFMTSQMNQPIKYYNPFSQASQASQASTSRRFIKESSLSESSD